MLSLDDSVGVGAGSGDLLSGLWHPQAVFPQLSADRWHALLAQARHAQLLPRLALRLAELAGTGGLVRVPSGPRAYLHSAQHLVRRQEQGVRWELVQLQQALRGLDTPVVLLKGAAYLAAGLPAAQGRVFGDIDLLLARPQLAAAEAALFGAGWIPSERDAYNQRYYREWMHELPPLQHLQRGTALDLHHTITPPTSAYAVDGERLLRAARPLPPLAPGLPPLWVLQPVDMVLHSAVHLFGEGEFGHGLRDLLDMHWLIAHQAAQQPDFWPALLARAAELRLGVPLWHALAQLQRLLGLTVPAAQRPALQALQPPAWQRGLLQALLTLALRPQHPSARLTGEGLARWLLYVRAHALRMPLRLLLPHLLRKAWMQHLAEPAAGQAQAGPQNPVAGAGDAAPRRRGGQGG